MSYYAVNFAAVRSREASQGSPPRSRAESVPLCARATGFGRTGATGYQCSLENLSPQFVRGGPLHYEKIESVRIINDNNNATPKIFELTAGRACVDWAVVTSLAGCAGVWGNNSRLCIEQPLNPHPSFFPWGAVTIDGATMGLYDEGVGNEVPTNLIEGEMLISDALGNYGVERFAEFFDSVNDLPAFYGTLARLRKQFEGGTARAVLGTKSDGTEAVARDCSLAFPPASRHLFLRSTDIGNLPEQIPSSILNNTPAHFRFFPQCFFRRTPYVRGIMETPTQCADSYHIAQGPVDWQPFTLHVVNRAPTSSCWRIVVDGEMMEVWVYHEGYDLRTGLEIWNRIWVPMFSDHQRTSNPQRVCLTWDRASAPATASSQWLGQISRMRYLQYAELLELHDGSSGLYTPTPQTDTVEQM